MSAGDQQLHDIFEPDVQLAPGEPITAVMIDGNSIAAVSGTYKDGSLQIHHAEQLELDRLVEITRRLRHPIFMDVSISHFPERELIRDRLRDLLQKPEFDHPVVVIFAPDKIRVEELTGSKNAEDRAQRAQMLLQGSLPINPYEYPSIIQLTEEDFGENESVTRLIASRLADLLPIVRIVRETGAKFYGMVSGLSASAQIVRRAQPYKSTKPIVLADIGKLRTLYTTLHPDGRITYFPIPVGLARDDVHYFKSIELSAEKLRLMQQSLGKLLFPPETTPSPLFSGLGSSPQIDCTRFAIQISRYTQRCLEALEKREKSEPYHPPQSINYLAGRASRLPGLRGYMEARLKLQVRRIDRRPLKGIELGKNMSWGDVADHLLPIGALIEVGASRENASGLLQGQLHNPPRDGASRCSITKMQPNFMYVFEQKVEML